MESLRKAKVKEMNVFGENLQFYRKKREMTQEQLAEKLDVSRQTVSKWEAGTSYPEMEKILQLCELFSCEMDTLLRRNAAELEIADSQGYDIHMDKFRRGITLGVMLLIFGVSLYELLSGFQIAEVWINTSFFAIMIVGILALVVTGMQHDIYRKNHQVVIDFYTKGEREAYAEKFPMRIAAGIGIILIGLLFIMNIDDLPLREGMTDDFYTGLFLILVAAGVGILVNTGIGKQKYEIAAYNQENNPSDQIRKVNQKIEVWCGCIMILATVFFFVVGYAGFWSFSWMAYPVGGLFCGMVALIFQGQKK